MKFSPVIAYGLKIVNNYVVLNKIDITMTTTNKKNGIDKSLILCDVDQLLKIQH